MNMYLVDFGTKACDDYLPKVNEVYKQIPRPLYTYLNNSLEINSESSALQQTAVI